MGNFYLGLRYNVKPYRLFTMAKTPRFQFLKQKKTRTVFKWMAGTFIVGGALISSCGSNDSSYNSYGSNQIKSTQGVITFMREVDSNDFKIIHEIVVSNKADSKIITTNLDGSVDTLSLDKARALDTTNTRERRYHRTFYGGMFGYMIGRSMGSPLNRSSYSSPSSYSNSTNSTTRMRSSISKPRTSFGSGKSFKSFGG